MINRKDVVKIRIPFPNLSSKLAQNSHMYICRESNNNKYSLVKCQTLKPFMIYQNVLNHYWDEYTDISRNPFIHTTRIDCDKVFVVHDVVIHDSLKTERRSDVCDDVMNNVENELIADSYEAHTYDSEQICLLNCKIYHR